MDIVSALVTHPQPAALVQPGQGSFDNPAVHAQPAAMPGAPLGNQRGNVARPQPLPMLPGVIGPVRIQPLGSAARTAPFAPDRRHPVHQGQQLGHVMAVGSGQSGRQRHPVAFGDHVMLAPRLAAIRRIGAGFSPRLQPPAPTHCPHRPGTSPVRPRPAIGTAGSHGAFATPRLPANPAAGASRSSPTRSPSPGATSPKECRSSVRRECRSGPSGRLCAGVQGTGTAWAVPVAAVAGLFPIARRSPVVSPSRSPCLDKNAASLCCILRSSEKVTVFQTLVKSFC